MCSYLRSSARKFTQRRRCTVYCTDFPWMRKSVVSLAASARRRLILYVDRGRHHSHSRLVGAEKCSVTTADCVLGVEAYSDLIRRYALLVSEYVYTLRALKRNVDHLSLIHSLGRDCWTSCALVLGHGRTNWRRLSWRATHRRLERPISARIWTPLRLKYLNSRARV